MLQVVLALLVLIVAPTVVIAEPKIGMPSVPYVEVVARAERDVIPDEVTITFSFSADSPDETGAATVTKELAERLSEISKALVELHIPERQITIDGPDISVRYKRQLDDEGREIYRYGARRPDGFEGKTTISVVTSNFAQANDIVAAGIRAGGALRPPTYRVSNAKAIEKDLAVEAVRMATKQARDMIKAADGRPGRVIFVGDPAAVEADGVADLPAVRREPIELAQVPLRPGKQRLSREARIWMEIKKD